MSGHSTAGLPTMTALRLALCAGFAMPLGLVAPCAAAKDKDPPPETEAPLRASLEVDAGAMGEDATAIEDRLRVDMGARLRKAEVLPRRELSDGLIHVDVSPLASGEPGFHFDVYAERNETRIDETLVQRECVGCSEDALVQQVAAAVDRCLPPLIATAPKATQQVQQEPDTPSDPAGVDATTRGRLRPMGKAGVALLVGGAAAAIVGAVFTVQGRTFDTQPGALQQEGVDFRPPGLGLLAGGSAALVTGAVLLGVDLGRAKREGRVAASVGRGWAGATWSGRF